MRALILLLQALSSCSGALTWLQLRDGFGHLACEVDIRLRVCKLLKLMRYKTSSVFCAVDFLAPADVQRIAQVTHMPDWLAPT